ncbi:MAG: hypothetical protein PHG66_01440 [Candidatus Colwellbacteria bacterium]|nr:hypothetical protein [Candidatus Colwellbacteria bacterium]
MNEKSITTWKGPVLIKLSKETISTCNPPSRGRTATRFVFPVKNGKKFFVYDHRERSLISARIYIGNKDILSMDINQRGAIEIREHPDGTQYAVIHDIREDILISHSLDEQITMMNRDVEWKTGEANDGRSLVISKLK